MIRRFILLLFLCSSLSFSEEVSPLSYDDPYLSSPALLSLLSSSSSFSPSGDITNDVQQILDLLNSVYHSATGDRSRLNVTAYAFQTDQSHYTIGQLMTRLFNEVDSNTRPNQSDGYLYEIQRALYGQRGIPSSSSAVIPLLQSLLDSSSSSTNSLALLEDFINTFSVFFDGVDQASSLESLGYTLTHFFDEDPITFLGSTASYSQGIYSLLSDVLSDYYYPTLAGDAWRVTLSWDDLDAFEQIIQTQGYMLDNSISNNLAPLLDAISALQAELLNTDTNRFDFPQKG